MKANDVMKNGTEALARRLDGSFAERYPAAPDLVGKLHDQDGVLGRQSHHRDEPTWK